MKKIILIFLSMFGCLFLEAQTNTFPSTGNAGVGTTSPQAKLEVAGSFRLTSNSPLPTSGQGLELLFQPSPALGIVAVTDRTNAVNLPMSFRSTNFDFSGGKVGIGITTPTYLLSVGGNATTVNGGQHSVLYTPTVTTGSYAGIVSQTIASPTATSSAIYYGVVGEAGDGSISPDLTSSYALIGVRGSVVHRGSGTITGSAALYAASPTITGTGAITTTYGLFINSMKVMGVTNGYGIYQSAASDSNYFAGNVGIGTTNLHGFALAVNGSAIATSMTVQIYANWPDYVFKPGYQLPDLRQVSRYIENNHHLPGMPTQEEVAVHGLDLGDINKQLTKKVEELTLYVIQQNKQLEDQQKINQSLQKQIDELAKQIKEPNP